jgi:hypothetical protein
VNPVELSVELAGDVTTHEAIANLLAPTIEMKIGFRPGRLLQGYKIYALKDDVAAGDFIWGDQTLYSGAWKFDDDCEELVPVTALLRAKTGKQSSYNENASDAELNRLQLIETEKLNVKTGSGKIVKLVPNTPHDPDRKLPWYIQYPDSKIAGTPQWKLIKKKKFVKIASVPADGRFR